MSVSAPEKIQNIDLYELTGISQQEEQEMEERALAGARIDVADTIRSAKSEIYGRSLSTIYQLGKSATETTIEHAVSSPEAEQAKIEFYTSVEEGFGTDPNLGGGLEVRDFDFRPIIDGSVMAKDLKRAISAMTKDGVDCAEEKFKIEKAQGDYRFLPQLIRSHWDHKNALQVDRMVRGETDFNTRIVVSPFPEEAAAKSGSAYWRDIGYVPHLKRGFVQLYFAGEEGLVSGSISFDGSNKQRLIEVFKKHGVDIPEDEVTDNWLQYAITDTLTVDQAKELALELADEAGDPKYKKTTNTVDVTDRYRPIVDRVFNESYIHACESLARGCQTPEARKLISGLAKKAHHFNDRYQEALYGMRADGDRFTDDDMVVIHELLVFSSIEMMRAFHLESEGLLKADIDAYSGREASLAEIQATMNSELFQQALSNFGVEGAIHNRIYSACGLSISLGGENDISNNPQAVFGGANSGEDKYGGLTFLCPNGHFNRRPYGRLLSSCQYKGCKAKVTC